MPAISKFSCGIEGLASTVKLTLFPLKVRRYADTSATAPDGTASPSLVASEALSRGPGALAKREPT